MVTQNNEEEVVEEETTSAPTKSRKKKSKYTHTQEDANTNGLKTFDIRIKETNDDGTRGWNEYKIAAATEKIALGLIDYDGYTSYSLVESDYED